MGGSDGEDSKAGASEVRSEDEYEDRGEIRMEVRMKVMMERRRNMRVERG